MKIKTRLGFNTWISLGMGILMLLILVWSFREAYRADRSVLLVHEIEKAVSDRDLLRDDYLLYGEERAKTQWLVKSETLRKLLKSTTDRFSNMEDKALMQDAQEDFEATYSLFSALSALMEKDKGAVRTIKKDNAFDAPDSRLIGQSLLKAYALNDSIARLHESSRRAALTARNRGVSFLLFIIVCGILAMVINSIVVNRIVAKRLTALHEGVKIIGVGNLDYLVDAAGDDELSDLARATNGMTAKLKESHTSVENLQREISERQRVEQEQQLAIEFLRIANECRGTRELIQSAVTFFQQQSGCEAVGLRLHDGEDYPYFEVRGFSEKFVLTENSLCTRDLAGNVLRDNSGYPIAECMCGNVIGGRFDPSKPFFTSHGSFWSNNTTQMLATTTEEDRKARTLNRCNGEGYESVALIPMRLGEKRFGLLQLNDRRIGMFSLETIRMYERLADHLSIALSKFRTEDELRESEERYRSLFENMLNGFAYCQMIFDQGKPADFIYLGVNRAFETLTGLKDVVGKKVTEIIPGIRESSPELLEIYGRVALTGRPEVFETYVASLKMWFSISVYSLKREYFVAVFDVITERKRAEEKLRQNEKDFRFLSREFHSLLDAVPDGLLRLDENLKVRWANKAAAREVGKMPDEIVGQFCYASWYGLASPCEPCPVVQCFETKNPVNITVSRPDGRIWDIRTIPLIDEESTFFNVIEVKRDITDHRHLEEQLHQVQKLESVGRLAGGVAHDFNNLLTTIIGNAEMGIMDLGKDDPLYGGLKEILAAGERAARLTGQLLAFSRKQVIQPEVVNLNKVVPEIEKILRRLIGEDIKLEIILTPEVGLVEADVGQIEQVIMNLAVNARDAMPMGGKLTIETASAELDEEYAASHVAVRPGPYVVLSVSDSGIGMSREVQAQIFEPFFTTKGKGKGTGLGLSTVYGIVKQNHGNIWVYSEEGRGTTFKIYLPRMDQAVEDVKSKDLIAKSKGGSETVLVVEDEESVRNLVVMVLKRSGYKVLTAEDGQEALEIYDRYEGTVHLLLTDVVMPRMNGKELAERLEGLHPEVKVLFMSGYTDNAIVHQGILDKGVAFIQKPFTPENLARKVREVLNG